MRASRLLLTPTTLALICAAAAAQSSIAQRYPIVGCPPVTAVEFIAPMFNEEVAVYHGPFPQSWHVILELALEQRPPQTTGVFEYHQVPSPGLTAVPPTDMNGDALPGDANPAIPALTLTMNDGLMVNGFYLPPGTNLASLFEMVGSELEHGGDQSTTLAWVITPQYMIVDVNGDQATDMTASLNNVVDNVHFRHGFDPKYMPCSLTSTPTVSIFTPDWISTVDDMVVPGDLHTAFLVGVEVRIPCYFNPGTVPPTPIPLDPIIGPAGGMPMTGNFLNVPGPGWNPAFPSLDVRFSDDYFDARTNSFVPGGVITGGTCMTIWGATGANLAFAFEQSSVDAWYGVNGVPNMAPVLSDDQLIYRFTMSADGAIFDTDALPGEMLITATIETECNVYSITNVRVKHRPDVLTPDPQ